MAGSGGPREFGHTEWVPGRLAGSDLGNGYPNGWEIL